MTAPDTYNALGKTLTKIKSQTSTIVRDSEYWNTSAGQGLKLHIQEQGLHALSRKTSQLQRQTRRAVTLSYLVDAGLGATVREVCEVTASVLACCDYFPRTVEWPGLVPLRRQMSLIGQARALIRYGSRR